MRFLYLKKKIFFLIDFLNSFIYFSLRFLYFHDDSSPVYLLCHDWSVCLTHLRSNSIYCSWIISVSNLIILYRVYRGRETKKKQKKNLFENVNIIKIRKISFSSENFRNVPVTFRNYSQSFLIWYFSLL